MNFKMVLQALQKERKRDPESWEEFKPMTPEYTMPNASLCSSIFWTCLFWGFLLIASYLDMHATTIALNLQSVFAADWIMSVQCCTAHSVFQVVISVL